MIPKETLEATLDDVEQLINFFVIEIQRIVFAENIPVTAAVSTVLSLAKPYLTLFLGFLDCIHQLLSCQTLAIMGICSFRNLGRLPHTPRLRLEQGTD